MNFENSFKNNYSPEIPPKNKNRYKKREDESTDLTRREFLKNAGLMLGGLAAMAIVGPKIIGDPIKKEREIERENIDLDNLKRMRPNLGYEEKYEEPSFDGLVLPGELNELGYLSGSSGDILDGTIIRSLRYENITSAVEKKYNLPSNLLLAMCAQESYGYNPLLNALGDGGVGLCHMQGMAASEYNLKTYKNCKALICNGKSKHSCISENGNKLNHGEDLALLVKNEHSNIKKLIEYDDRFHPIINLDAAARMIAYHMARSERSGMNPMKTAMKRYSGRDPYWGKVKELMKYFNNRTYLETVEEKFNLLNNKTKMNSKEVNFKQYIEESQEQNYNYQLEKYKSSIFYRPKNSDQVLKHFQA